MNPTRRPIVRGLGLILVVLMLPGCGYSLSGRGSFLPAYIKRIGIPDFSNSTTVLEADRRITEQVRSEFIGRGKYTVVQDSTGVDAVLTGAITSITLTPSGINAQGQATRLLLTLTASVEFRDVRADKVLWANPAMQFREDYQIASGAADDPNAFFGQDVNALTRLSTEFARALVSAILEAF